MTKDFSRKIKAVIGYDGTDYSGFQRQKGAFTVQEALETALSQVLGHKTVVIAAGRTDKGVHARGQVVVFKTASKIPAEVLPKACLGLLPQDIFISSARDVPLSFNPLKDAVSKTYCYRIWRDQFPDVFWKRYSWWYPGRLDFELLEGETADLLGEHDFANFRVQNSSVKTTVRRIFGAYWKKDGFLWEFHIIGSGFLYKMARLLVGTLVDVGRGRFPPGKVKSALERFPEEIGVCAPPLGLCMEEVRFS